MIRNTVIGSVIAGVILLYFPVLRDYVISFFTWIWAGITLCWNAIFQSYSFSGWFLLLIFIFAFIGLITIIKTIKGKLKEPEFKSYVEDTIYQAKWRWKWSGEQVLSLWCYCPCCDASLVYNDSSNYDRYSSIKKTEFICENCDKIITSIKGGNKNYAVSAVEREIERRIRTNEYKTNQL
ncbi:hypothetical protein [Arcobacter sp.]|uniref:hypothetical protein n=1 Tax=unclassified Arcobacter TaxID=2593671 RepID=UPI003AFF9EE0